MRVKVYLVDDHRLFLAGVKAELSEEFAIVGSAYDVDTAIEEIRGLEPDVVLIDVHMPDGGGIVVVESVGETNPEVKFLALSVSDQAEDVIGMIRAGARGYVTKTIEPGDLVGCGASDRCRRRGLLATSRRVRPGCLRRRDAYRG